MKERDIIQDDKIITVYEEDVSMALEQAKAERNAANTKFDRFPRDREFHRVAYIPQTVVLEMQRRGINFFHPDEKDQKAIKALLNGEFAYLKTVDAKL